MDKVNTIIEHNDYCEIIVNSKTYGEIRIKIDKEDVDKLKDKRIYVSNEGKKNNLLYPVFFAKDKSNKRLRLHRYLVNCPDNKVVDHINFDTLDNRKENLQIVDMSFNSQKKDIQKTISNTGIRNISKNKNGLYEVCFYENGKRVFRKSSASLEKAIKIKENYNETRISL